MEDIHAAADSIATAISHPVTVQLITQGAGIWGNVATGLITGLLTGGITLAGIWLTHRFTLQRERQASEDKLARERLFIATELIILLEQYAEDCAAVADDHGEIIFEPNRQAERLPRFNYPVPLNFENVLGDWRSLPAVLMFRIRELPLLRADAMRAIEDSFTCDFSHDSRYFFRERQFRFARMGLKAIHLARQLRRLCGLPRSRLNASAWSAQPVMLNVLHRERKHRFREAKEYDLVLRSY
ncbi:hypothetical protein ACN5L4_003689 [Cronobacter turicensis]